jgi:hypothetical protein
MLCSESFIWYPFDFFSKCCYMELISVGFLGFCLVAEKIHEDKRK